MQITFEEYLKNHCNQTIDFQIISLGKFENGKSSFCIFPINTNPQQENNKKHAVFEISGNSLKFNGHKDPDEIDLDQQAKQEPEATQISSSTTMEQYLAMHPSNVRLRFDTSSREKPSFYIHPINQDGETLTFEVEGSVVNLIPHPTQQQEEQDDDEED